VTGVSKYSGASPDPVKQELARVKYQQKKAREALVRQQPVTDDNLPQPHRRALVIAARGGGLERCNDDYWNFAGGMARVKAPVFDDLIKAGLANPDGTATSLGSEKAAEILSKEDGYDLLKVSKSACMKCNIEPRRGWKKF